MTGRRLSLLGALTSFVLLAGCRSASNEDLAAGAVSHLEGNGDSELVTWICTGDVCPWGSPVTGQALVWPAPAAALGARLGYVVSAGIYLPADRAAGATISVTSGTAAAYVGQLDAISHRQLGSIEPGQPLRIAGLAAGEVVSVQSDTPFGYALSLVDPGAGPAPTPPAEPPATPPAEPPATPPAEPPVVVPPAEPPPVTPPPPPPPAPATESASVTWTCAGAPCPWGQVVGGLAIAWPASAHPLAQRLGYAVSAGIYLPADNANGVTVSVDSGVAGVYAGQPADPSHRFVTSIAAGQSYQIAGLAAGEVVSVQSDSLFTYRITAPGTSDPASSGPVGPGPVDPNGGDPTTDPVDLGPAVAMTAVPAFWRCDNADCNDADWTGAVIDWPSSSAYQSNVRAGQQGRSVFSASGEPLHPYMGAWAQGCEVTATEGTVLIIEWLRGSDIWRATLLNPGDTHVIDLISPEDGAMIETVDAGGIFSVSVRNCTPRPLP